MDDSNITLGAASAAIVNPVLPDNEFYLQYMNSAWKNSQEWQNAPEYKEIIGNDKKRLVQSLEEKPNILPENEKHGSAWAMIHLHLRSMEGADLTALIKQCKST